MSKSMEIGIIIIPDDLTQKAAKKLHLSSLEVLTKNKILDKDYENNFPNNFHITLFQLRIMSDSLSLLSDKVEKILADYPTLAFKMDKDLEDTQQHIFWGSKAAENLPSFKKLHREVVHSAKNLRDLTKPFSQANPTGTVIGGYRL